MINAAVTLPEADIEALEQFYTFKGPELQFLNQNPSLVPVLLEAPEKIHHYFPNSQLSLESSSDTEIIDWVQLILFIRVSLDSKEAMDRLYHLDQDWWLNTPEQAREQICILLAYP